MLGQPVQLVTASEGTSVNDACRNPETAGQQRRRDHRPGIVARHLEVLDELMDAGVLVCSPTATALALNDYPNRILLPHRAERLVGGQAIAVVALNTGVDSYAVVYLDDQFGRPFAQRGDESPRRAGGHRPLRGPIPGRRHAGGAG